MMATVTLASEQERAVGGIARNAICAVVRRFASVRPVMRWRGGRRIGLVRQALRATISCVELEASPKAPFRARQHAKGALVEWQLSPEIIDTAELLVSELITNAITVSGRQFGQTPYPGTASIECVSLTLRRLPDRVVIEVFDNDPNPPIPADVDPESESGRGLMLVQALSKEWGHFSPPTGGKIVYCVLSTPSMP